VFGQQIKYGNTKREEADHQPVPGAPALKQWYLPVIHFILSYD
jgi:hypothetical protein